ncbi:MAG: beta-ketoacyl-[acyl-carrier-protein] synthase family protein [Candidatus Thiodiazotropha sp. (ex Cardiolucina cf. quadrata)]|nr:beta-ketoacyl-[acyl-carrier-protein] synthase family protein [Candidatus Thiodiazotropha sp. (ex Cardiolucina cf. quadrata)]
MPITPLQISHYTLTSALGKGVDENLQALRSATSGLQPCSLQEVEFETWIGRVEGVEDEPLPEHLQAFDCRNNRLAWMAVVEDGFRSTVQSAIERIGSERIGLFIGTSTSGIASTESAYQHRDIETGSLTPEYSPQHSHNIFSSCWFLREALALKGPALTISTACSSSAKVFAAAHRYISSGLCDAAVVGGVDSLCLTTLYGFNSLGLISPQPCRPWGVERDGINIGEAAGFVLLEPVNGSEHQGLFLGYGESSDAYHMSTPHPDGEGAAMAMRQAIERAGLSSDRIDYINLHGTATPSNDAAEDKAVWRLFNDSVACSSTKGWTGHTLGAAGITEAVFSLLSLKHGFLPGTMQTEKIDPALHTSVLLESRSTALHYVLSNSFGFGGSNCSLLFGSRN